MRPAARAQATGRGGWRRSWRSLDMRSTHCSIRGRSGRPLADVVEHPGDQGQSSSWISLRIWSTHSSIRGRSGRPLAGVVEHPGGQDQSSSWISLRIWSTTARYGVGLVVHWLASSNIQAIRIRAVRGSRSGSGRPTARYGTRSGRTGWRHRGPARRSDGHRR